MKDPQPILRRVRRIGNRTSCIGNCGKLVKLPEQECRKCKRKRMHAGMKRIRKIERAKVAEAQSS